MPSRTLRLVVVFATAPSLVAAQAVSSLGAEALIGTAGITAVNPGGSPGTATNPAAIGEDHRWSIGIASLTAPSTDVTEQALGASVRAGPLGIGLHLSNRRVNDLFDDPTLEEAGLDVEDTGISLGASVAIRSRIRVGVASIYSGSTVLGTSSSSLGGRVGLAYHGSILDLGAYYGSLEPATRRMALAASVDATRFAGIMPRLTLEVNLDEGNRSARYLRGSAGWSVADGLLCLLAGTTIEIGRATVPNTQEGALGVQLKQLFLYFGARFGAEPAPGNTYAVGVVLRGLP